MLTFRKKMRKFSYYIYVAVVLTGAIFTGCTDEEKADALFTGSLNIFDFAPATGKGGTQVLINGEQFTSDASVSINGVNLTVLQSNEEQLLVEIPDNELADNAPLEVTIGGNTVRSKANFTFQKVAVESFSPAVGKVGTKVNIYVSNLPSVITNLSASLNDKAVVACIFDEEKKCFVVTIPELSEEGVCPLVLQFNGRTLSVDFEYDDAPIFERTITTLPGSDELSLRSSIWEGGTAQRLGSIAVDNAGNVYVGELGRMRITKITPDGQVIKVAGTGAEPDWAINWRLEDGGSYRADVRPCDIKVDGDGNMYSCDNWIGANIFFEPDGKAHYLGNPKSTTIAIDEKNRRFYMRNENSLFMKSLDDHGAELHSHGDWLYDTWGFGGMDVDKNTGDLYLVNTRTNKILRCRYTASGLEAPEEIAGSGEWGRKDGTCKEASFANPWGIAVTLDGNLLVAGNGSQGDENGVKGHIDQSIRYIDLKTGMVTTLAGSGISGNEDGTFVLSAYAVNSSEEELPASFGAPSAVCVGQDGTIYVLDKINNCVKKIVTVER